jgi:3-dehydroquinate synthase
MRDIVMVNLKTGRYTIHIKDGLLAEAGRLIKDKGLSGKALLITDGGVPDSIIKSVKISLHKNGILPFVYKVRQGERSKTLKAVLKIYEFLTEKKFERFCPIVATGGGMVGDLAGFVSATYKRGMPFVQIPTTLLAQIDASIGGKVAVNYGRYKNIIGAFYQPVLVVIDPDVLKTLPYSEFVNGMFEVIKYGVIQDAKLFYFVKNNFDNVSRLINCVVNRCCRIKVKIVQQDERDFGRRMLLNFGHTVGHAIESLSNYRLSHGEVIGVGMVVETLIARRLGLASKHVYKQIKEVVFKCFEKMGTHIKMVCRILAKTEQILKYIEADKKTKGGRNRFALCCKIGKAVIKEGVSDRVIVEAIRDFRQDLANT